MPQEGCVQGVEGVGGWGLRGGGREWAVPGSAAAGGAQGIPSAGAAPLAASPRGTGSLTLLQTY